MPTKYYQPIFSLLALSLTLSACGDKRKSAAVAINVLNAGMMVQNLSFDSILNNGDFKTMDTGFNTASGLEELIYPFDGISMCENVSGKDNGALSSFGFDSQTGCTSLYRSSTDGVNHIGMEVPDLITHFGSADNTFNLVNSTDLARLKAASQPATVGNYNYVAVTWPALIGVRGTVAFNGHTLHTKAATGYSGQVTTVSDMTTAGTERVYIASANGGMVSKFQRPLSVVDGGEYLLDIIVNPEGVLKACTGGAQGNIRDGAYGLTVPMLPITAVLREKTDTLVRESYTIATSRAGVNYRLDLYYLKSDATKAILATTLTGLASNTDGDCFSNSDNRILRVVQGTDGNYTFYNTSADTSQVIYNFGRTSTGGNLTVRPNDISAGNSSPGLVGLPGATVGAQPPTTPTTLTYSASTTTELN